MSKYSYEEKLKVVLGVVEKGMSFETAGKTIGACKKDATKWVKMYEEHGTAGLTMKKGTYDGQFKISVIEYMHTNYLSCFETATKFGIPSHSTVGKWERIYYEEGREALFRDNRGRKRMSDKNKPNLDKKTEEDLLDEVQRLRAEVAYLKKLNALVSEKELREKKRKRSGS